MCGETVQGREGHLTLYFVLSGMTEPNEQYAYFTITGDFDPAEITEVAGIAPSDSWRKGDVNPKTHLERTFSRWSLYSRLDRSRKLEDHVADVIEQMDAKKENFVALSLNYGGQMELVAYFKTNYPGIVFQRHLVEGLAEYELLVDFDFYYLYSDRREDS